jgi:hypothetical protein
MLLQNGSFFSAEPINRVGSVDLNSSVVPWGRGGTRFSRWWGDGGFDVTLGNPPGYTHPVAWSMAQSGTSFITEVSGTAGLSGSGAVAAGINSILLLSSSLAGQGVLIGGQMVTGYIIAASLSGAGDLSGDAQAIVGALMIAALSGSGDITQALGFLSAQMTAALAGAGTLAADIIRAQTMVAELAGTASFTAAASAIGHLNAELVGAGAILAAMYTKNFMSADIVVTGDVLTASTVAEAVWSAIAANNDTPDTMGEKLNDAGSASNPWTEVIESGFTAGEILKMLSAVMAGKSSGGGGATITFRDLADSKDRIVATVDSNGNRTAITRDAS